jgi:hypothetical protein
MGAVLLYSVLNNMLIVINRAALLGEKSPEMKIHSNRRIVALHTICVSGRLAERRGAVRYLIFVLGALS